MTFFYHLAAIMGAVAFASIVLFSLIVYCYDDKELRAWRESQEV